MYASLVTGATSHKLVQSDVSKILWLYYNNRVSFIKLLNGFNILIILIIRLPFSFSVLVTKSSLLLYT